MSEWIEWNGGECPVGPDVTVAVKLRFLDHDDRDIRRAIDWRWDNTGMSSDIVAYKIVSEPDPVNHPPHYNQHPSGVECITIIEHMGFNLGNAIKYIWRADLKADAIEDLKKARWYIDRELKKRGVE